MLYGQRCTARRCSHRSNARGENMDTYTTVKNRLLLLCEEKGMSIHKLAMESAVPPSTIKNILYGKSLNPGIVTIKMLCDGLGITLPDFFATPDFKNLEQEIR